MSAASLEIINAAALRVGEDAITALDDGSTIGKIATNTYDKLVASELGNHRWKFASKTQALSALDGDPDPPWTFMYQLPTDVLLLRTLKVDGEPIPYELMYDKVLCDTDPDQGEDVIAHYAWRPDEAKWSPYFAELVIRRLEVIFLRANGERYTEASARQRDAEIQFMNAKRLDSQSQPPVDPVSSPTLEARRA